MSKVRVDLQSNVCTITPSRRVEVALADVPRAVKRAGFQPGEMVVEARGGLEDGRFRIRGWRVSFALRGDISPASGERVTLARVDYSREELILEPLR